MKTIIHIFNVSLIIVILNVSLYSDWIWQNPLPQGNELRSTYFLNSQTGFACGYGGTILKTTNGGTNWSILKSDVFKILFSVYFTDINTGYVSGESGIIFKTTNGGTNWFNLNSGTNENLFSLCFTSASTGYCVMRDSVLKTTDAGLNWTKQPVSSSLYSFSNIFFPAPDTGYCTGSGTPVFKTTNAGNNWFITNGPQALNMGLYFINSLTGFICGGTPFFGGTFYTTTNGGNNWYFHDSISPMTFYSICFTSQNNGFMSGSNGSDYSYILKTTNMGVNWGHLYLGVSGMTFHKIFFPDAANGFTVGSGGNIFRSTNNGSNWSSVTYGTSRALYSFACKDSLNGIAVGERATILLTTNSGEIWTSVYPPNYLENIRGIQYVGGDTVYAAGTIGKFYKSFNGGQNWNATTINTYNDNYGMLFINSQTGFLTGYASVSYYGYVWRTTNAGANWNYVYSGSSKTLKDIVLFGNIGYVIGDASQSSALLKTNNGGLNWSVLINWSNSEYNCMYFKNSMTGFVGGAVTSPSYRESILRTTDGGLNWIEVLTSPVFGKTYTLTFLDSNTGYAGSSGRIYKTTNGGSNWYVTDFYTSNLIYKIKFLNNNLGYCVGSWGTILRTTNGGCNIISSIPDCNSEIPGGFRLFKNFPNPFNASTKIKFRISENSFHSLKVYDVLGRLVTVLSEGIKQPGEYEIIFNASHLPGGIYLCIFENQNNFENIRMILIK